MKIQFYRRFFRYIDVSTRYDNSHSHVSGFSQVSIQKSWTKVQLFLILNEDTLGISLLMRQLERALLPTSLHSQRF